jgi:hypothetical protein
MLKSNMKKFIIILLSLVLLVSCQKDYKCVIKYQVTYPDTTWVHTYEFDGSIFARPAICRYQQNGRTGLEIYPYEMAVCSKTIAAVPNSTAEINVLDFKMYKYGLDIPKKEK